jgi:hypothetical protein
VALVFFWDERGPLLVSLVAPDARVSGVSEYHVHERDWGTLEAFLEHDGASAPLRFDRVDPGNARVRRYVDQRA